MSSVWRPRRLLRRPQLLPVCMGTRRFCAARTADSAVAPGAESSSAPSSEPVSGFHCGGFFMSVDPNIGLGRDVINPIWRFQFIDQQSQKKQRIPYKFQIQHQGPHLEAALRFQTGFATSSQLLTIVPSSFRVLDGWEATLPLPLCAWRLCKTSLAPNSGGVDEAAVVTVWRLDCPLGLSGGFHSAVDGVGARGEPETTWRGEGAKLYFALMVVFLLGTLPSLPGTWPRVFEIFSGYKTDPQAYTLFSLIDTDMDGVIKRESLKNFLDSKGLSHLLEPGELMERDQIRFEDFRIWLRSKDP